MKNTQMEKLGRKNKTRKAREIESRGLGNVEVRKNI